MADVNSIIEDLAAAIKSDSALSAWCVTTFDRELSVSEGYDPLDDPEEVDVPLVILFPLTKSGGLDRSVKLVSVQVSCIVFDDGQPDLVSGVARYSGSRNVETLRQMVVDVIRDNLPAGIMPSEIETSYMDIGEFSFFTAVMAMSLIEEQLIGADPLE